MSGVRTGRGWQEPPPGRPGPPPADLVGPRGLGPVAEQQRPQLLEAPRERQVTHGHVRHRALHAAPAPPRPRGGATPASRQSAAQRGPVQPIAPARLHRSPLGPRELLGFVVPRARGRCASGGRRDCSSQGAPRRGRVVPPCRGEGEEDGDSGRMEAGEGRGARARLAARR